MQRAAFALAVGLLAALPLLLRGPSCGHDFDFHLQSWFAVRESWRQGLPVPHWVPGANYGAGEPRFVFYPPLTWLLGAALGCVLPWALVPAAFTALCFAGAAWSMHRVAARLLGAAKAPVAAALYALSPYLLFTGYERTAYGELLAAAWMPLLLEALMRRRWISTALLVAALWYTNAPAAVMGCYLVLLALGWRLALRSRAEDGPAPHAARALPLTLWQNTRQSTGALLLGGALAADYLLPAWYEQRFVAIGRAVGPGMRVEDSFLFSRTGEPFHDQVLRTASWIAVATFSAGALGAFGWARRALPVLRRASLPQEGQQLSFLPLLLAACLLLQFPFTHGLWHTLPELAFLQFPWRLLLPASAAAALLLAAAVPRFHRRAAVWTLTFAYAAGTTAWAGHTRYQPCDDEDNVTAQQALLASGSGFEGTDEYTPAGADNGEIQRGLPRVRLLPNPDADEGDSSGSADALTPPWPAKSSPLVPGRIEIRLWSSEALRVRAAPAHDAYAVLRLEHFPPWQVQLNGAPCASACVPRDDGLVTVHLPAGRMSDIDARYQTTRDVELGRALSLAASLAVLVRAARHGRQRRPPPEREQATQP